jgi:hypothetical protein
MNLSQNLRYSYLVVIGLLLAACSQSPSPTTLLESQLFETQKVTYSFGDAQALGYFGTSVAIDGDFMVVGASGNVGAVYLYQKTTTGSWQLIKKLLASDGGVNDLFGYAVAISGNTVVVGAFGNYYDIRTTSNRGSAYIFERNQGGANNWGQAKKLIGSGRTRKDLFGSAVAISGNTVVVGARGNYSAGSVYIFSRNQGGTNLWGQIKKLEVSDGRAGDGFGSSLAISGNTLVVGALGDDIGTNADQGSAYIFLRDRGGTNAWGQIKKLVASDGKALDHFGSSGAISGNTVVVSAYIFERDQGGAKAWGEVKRLMGKVASSVAISGDSIVVGTIPGQVAYLFKRNKQGLNAWGLDKRFLPSDPAPEDSFGSSVAISANTTVVGAPGDDIGDNFDQGSAYIFKN